MSRRRNTASDRDPMPASAEPAAAPAPQPSPPSSEKPAIGAGDGTGGVPSQNEGANDELPAASAAGDGAAAAAAAPPPAFRPGDVVYASDPDGLVYEATVRRRLYGAQQQRQVRAGPVALAQEAEEEAPTWHYFVHYHGWAVKWDHWISAAQVYPKSEASRQLAKRLEEEHKALMKEMSGGAPRKKQGKAVDAAAFYTEWRRRMERIYQAYHAAASSSPETLAADVNAIENRGAAAAPHAAAPTQTRPAKRETWSKAAVEAEVRLREKGLTGVYKHGDKILLADTLKRILVDSWEIITHCGFVPDLPAPVTVRDALSKYLESKGVVADANDSVVTSGENSTTAATTKVSGTTKTTTVDSSQIDNHDTPHDSRQQWIDMRDGICMYFDEALPKLLLYPQEIPQLRSLHSHQDDEAFNKPYSEIYGTEHLLRLLTKLPELMHGDGNEAELRPVLAKINDFVRFLQRDGSLFALNYRPYNESELKEKEKIVKAASRKRLLDTQLDILASV